MQQTNSQKLKYKKTQRQVLICTMSAPPARWPYAASENVALQKDLGIINCATKIEARS